MDQIDKDLDTFSAAVLCATALLTAVFFLVTLVAQLIIHWRG